MSFDDKRRVLRLVLAGGLLGVAAWALVSWLTQPGALFTGHLGFAFTFYYGSLLPGPVGALLSGALWFAFGAEAAAAALPFADAGRALLLRSLLHFAAMMGTVALWAFVNFFNSRYPMAFFRYDLWSFLTPVALVYLLVWLGRWVGWYAEAGEMRERLGLTAGPSPLKWRESLPHIGSAFFLCLGLPALLALFDPPDVPILTALLFPWLLLPVGSFFSALSLGRCQGFCPLYPLACALFTLLFILAADTAGGLMLPIALVSALLGSLLGALIRLWRERACKMDKDSL